MSVYRALAFVSFLAITVSASWLGGDIQGTRRTLEQDEHRIAFLQGIIKQEYIKLQTYSLVTNAASDYIYQVTKERDEAITKYENIMDTLWANSDASCAVMAVYRAQQWKLQNVGLWSGYLHVELTGTVTVGGVPLSAVEGHLVFAYEDSEGVIRVFSNGRGSVTLGKIGHDPIVIAKAYYSHATVKVVNAFYEE